MGFNVILSTKFDNSPRKKFATGDSCSSTRSTLNIVCLANQLVHLVAEDDKGDQNILDALAEQDETIQLELSHAKLHAVINQLSQASEDLILE